MATKESNYSSIGQTLVTSLRVLRFAWKYDTVLVVGLALTSLLLALFPFAQSGISAILVNTLVAGGYVPATISLLLFGYALTVFLPEAVSSLNSYFRRRNYINLSRSFSFSILKPSPRSTFSSSRTLSSRTS